MIEINEMKFEARSDCKYKHDYAKAVENIKTGKWEEKATWRELVLNDLWFIVYFVLKVKGANHPFIVDACREVEDGEKTKTLDLWARGHFKSTIITTAEVLQIILANPESRVGIFSHTRPASKSFLRRLKLTMEGSEMLLACFPDVLYAKPETESPKWSEDDGLIVRRSGYYNEATLEAWGLVEGTPVGKHFTFRVYDDIETPDMVTTPEVISKLKNMFDVSQNLSDKDARYRIVGTPYHYDGLIQHLRNQRNGDGTLKYVLRLKPATVDGSANGEPVYLSKEELEDLKTTQNYNAQQLLDPTPLTDCKLRSDYLKDINPEFIPANVYKFMVIDPAGDNKDGKGDSWAIHVVGIEPKIDEIGASNIYITDSMISPMNDSEAIECISRMYINGGMIMQIGVEKTGLSSVEVHVANALRARGRHISIETNSLVLLRPAGRPKTTRIMQALKWSLDNGKIFISNRIPAAYRERLRSEMDRFPFWHDDGLDALSYFYDMAKAYRFGITNSFTKKLKYNMAGIV